MRKLVHTVVASDVGKGAYFGGPSSHRGCFAPLGRVQKCDVGKRIYLVSCDALPVYQVENDEQRDRRLGR